MSQLVMFSPMPPERNGIADYTAELLPLLAERAEVVIVVDDHADLPEHAACHVLRLAEYATNESSFRGWPHIYQVGNNAGHTYMLPWIVRRPGVLVLHDVTLHHLVDQATVRWGDLDSYERILEIEYGHHGRLLADQFRSLRWRSRGVFHDLPLIRELVARSRAVLVHSFYAACKVMAQQPETPVQILRHHVAPSAQVAGTRSRAAARRVLGVAEDALYIVSLGFVTRSKQIDIVLRFLARHRHEFPDLRYAVVGQDNPEEFDVRSMIADLELGDIASVTGYVDEPTFYDHVIASDLVVNLRYPSGGETSGTLMRALGAGSCVVVNDIGPFAELPSHVCVKVPMTDDHAARFNETLLTLLRQPARRESFRGAARDHMLRAHSIDSSVRCYLDAVQKHARNPALPGEAVAGFEWPTFASMERRLADIPAGLRPKLPLWATTGQVPVDAPDEAARVLLIHPDDHWSAWLSALYGYAPDRIDVIETNQDVEVLRSWPRRTHCVALARFEASQPMVGRAAWLVAINMRLSHGSIALVSMVRRDDQPVAALNQEMHSLLVSCGYRVERFVRHRDVASFVLDGPTTDVSEPQDSRSLLWQASKVSEFVSLPAAIPR